MSLKKVKFKKLSLSSIKSKLLRKFRKFNLAKKIPLKAITLKCAEHVTQRFSLLKKIALSISSHLNTRPKLKKCFVVTQDKMKAWILNNGSKLWQNLCLCHQRLSIILTERVKGASIEDKEQLDFIGDVDDALYGGTPRYLRFAPYTIFFVLFTAIIWSHFAVIDQVTVTEGKVVPSAQTQVIQNLEGGIVQSINVKEGESVKKGQILMTLNNTRWRSDYQEQLVKAYILQANLVRLKAQSLDKKTITFPQYLKKNAPNIINEQKKLFISERTALLKSLHILNSSYQLTQKELKLIEPLVKERIVSQVEFLTLKRNLNELAGKITAQQEGYRAEKLHKLNELKSQLVTLQEALKKNKDRLKRTTLKAPVNGVVNNIYASTIGEVIQPGVNIMEIVPSDGALTIEAFVPPQDIAFIAPKQKAIIKVSAYDFSLYGGVMAHVTTVGANTLVNEEGHSYFEIKLKADKNHLGNTKNRLPIIPGMTVSVHIINGKRSILSYLINPLIRATHQALREG